MQNYILIKQQGKKRYTAIPHNANSRKMWYNIGMDKQLSLSALSDELSQVLTKKREFLDEIERIVP